MASLMALLNRFLPFATPGTPLLQDLLHLTALCVLLYFAPQIQQRYEKWRFQNSNTRPVEEDNTVRDNARQNEAAPVGEVPDVPDHDPVALHNAHDQDHGNADLPPNPNGLMDDGQPGPATVPPARNVGAKKAKSLARKDQRRAYNEFMRSQGDAQRARDAEGAVERDAALAVERERRALVEKDLQSRLARERDAKKEREDYERRENVRRTEMVLEIVRDELDTQKMCNLFKVADAVGNDVDEEWVERILKSSGTLGKKDDAITMITQTGWIVVVTAEDMAAVYQAAITNNMGDEHGKITSEEIAVLVESILKLHADYKS